MKRVLGALFLAALVLGLTRLVGAADEKAEAKPSAKTDNKAAAVIDKAVEAIGGSDKLRPIKAATWKTKGKITINNDENEFSSTTTVCGLHQSRQEFEGTFNGDKIKGVTVLDHDKGWRKFNDDVHEMDKEAVANEHRLVFLQIVAANPLLLKADAFKLESIGEEKVGDKPAVGIKVTGPDGKEFTMYYDKETGLPVRQVAKVIGWQGEEFTQDVSYADYKEFDGIKKATKLESKRNGEKFIENQVTDFKPSQDKTDADQFAEPK